MKFVLGPPLNSLSDAEFETGEWKRVLPLPLWAVQVTSPIAGALFVAAIFVMWAALTPRFPIEFAPTYQVLSVAFAVSAWGLLLQVMCHPSMGMSAHSVVGLWLSRVVFYTAFRDKLPKWRCVLQLCVPFVVLAVVPLVGVAALRVTSGWLVFVSCWAAFIFGLNILIAVATVIQVPNGSLMAGRRFESFWKRQ